VTPTKQFKGFTHWAIFEPSNTGWRRATVYRIVGVDAAGAVFHFESVKGSARLKRHVSMLFTDTFRPIASNGGRR
jgi:hypothetical protein